MLSAIFFLIRLFLAPVSSLNGAIQGQSISNKRPAIVFGVSPGIFMTNQG